MQCSEGFEWRNFVECLGINYLAVFWAKALTSRRLQAITRPWLKFSRTLPIASASNCMDAEE